MKAAVVIFPGSNCDRDTLVALERITGRKPTQVWHTETELPACDLVVLPGGFTYGDYLRVGAMAARSPVMAAVKKRAEDGAHVLGICNGFQMLTETGLLPGALMRNADLKFLCKDVHLSVERNDTAFTRKYPTSKPIRIPIAHHDGNYFADDETLARLEGEGRVAFRYVTKDGAPSDAANPNGSRGSIAGIYSDDLRVLGMMPHPERLIEPALGGSDGRPMFEGLLEALSS
ncbi:phosphoribosylformylglycinamidine synthase subunit PurQ [Pyruvatibacter sp.]|uniref:phosphoribosylformylglycinamidine synthase subunit PurQ n=1 Tax=Pyruvatibacter sp. TaxID=1981328 RepID=UPI00326791D5